MCTKPIINIMTQNNLPTVYFWYNKTFDYYSRLVYTYMVRHRAKNDEHYTDWVNYTKEDNVYSTEEERLPDIEKRIEDGVTHTVIIFKSDDYTERPPLKVRQRVEVKSNGEYDKNYHWWREISWEYYDTP